jgi:peptidoglycan/LPS O-acetylase OafA/YrhL
LGAARPSTTARARTVVAIRPLPLQTGRPAADYRAVDRLSTHGRLRSLDGLRGVAALVVVLYHVVSVGSAPLSAAVELGTDLPGVGHWVLRTPLAIWWAGPELVIVFFVLSGFVLARALLHDRPSWPDFLTRRVVRLYLPAWASLVVAALLMAVVVTPTPSAGAGFWWLGGASSISAGDVARQASLVLPDGHGAPLNGVLWSLRWEVLFSAALPILLLAAGTLRRAAVPVAAVVLAAACWGPPAATYLAPFMMGLLLALHEPRLARLRRRLDQRGGGALLVLAAVLLTADLWLPGAQRARGGAGTLVVAGAVCALLAPLLYDAVALRLEHRVAQWLGSRSFSIYLVHNPIITACANGLHRPPLLPLLVVAVPASLLFAEAFHRLVERPSHALARKAFGQMSPRTGKAPAPRAA